MEHAYLLHLKLSLFSILFDGSSQYSKEYSIKITSLITNVLFVNIEV